MASNEYKYSAFAALDGQRRDRVFTDGKLRYKMNGQYKTRNVHKCLLAVASPHLAELLKTDSIIDVNGDKTSVDGLIDYIYDRPRELNATMAASCLRVAAQFDILPLFNECNKVLFAQLSPSTSLETWLAARGCCAKLADACIPYIADSFHSLDMLELDEDVYTQLIAQLADQLSGQTIYSSIIRWVRVDEECRKGAMPSLFDHVKLTQLPSIFLVDVVKSEPLVAEQKTCYDILVDELARRALRLEADPRPPPTPTPTPSHPLFTDVHVLSKTEPDESADGAGTPSTQSLGCSTHDSPVREASLGWQRPASALFFQQKDSLSASHGDYEGDNDNEEEEETDEGEQEQKSDDSSVHDPPNTMEKGVETSPSLFSDNEEMSETLRDSSGSDVSYSPPSTKRHTPSFDAPSAKKKAKADSPWKASVAMPCGLSWCSAAILDGCVFVTGESGRDGATLFKLDRATDSWSSLALPADGWMAWPKLVVVQRRLYAVGENDTHMLVCEWDGSAWKTISDEKTCDHGYAETKDYEIVSVNAAGSGGRIYIACREKSLVRSIDVNQPERGWRRECRIPNWFQQDFALFILNQQITFVGGRNGHDDISATVSYNDADKRTWDEQSEATRARTPPTVKWRKHDDMGTARSFFGAAQGENGRVYVVGGQNGVKTVEELSVSHGQLVWRYLAPLASPRAGCGVVVSDDELIVVGGSVSRRLFSTMETLPL